MADWRTELEAELRALRVDVPPAADQTADVLRRLKKPPPRRWPLVAAAVAIVVVAVFAITPPGQAVISDIFRFAGIEIRQDPGPTPTHTGSLPGERHVSLDQARKLVAFPVFVPASLGKPTDVVVSDGGRVLSLTYKDTPYGEVRIDEFDGHLEPALFQKMLHGNNFAEVDVRGANGLWIEGPHGLIYIRKDGQAESTSARLTTGNTLIWDTGKVVIRLEGVLTRDQALAIATSG